MILQKSFLYADLKTFLTIINVENSCEYYMYNI